MLEDDEYLQQMDEKLKETEFFVRAGSFAKQALWKRYHEEVKWEDEGVSYSLPIGKIGDQDILMDINWSRLNDKLIAFWTFRSNLFDYSMAEKYLKKYQPTWDNGTRLAHTNDWNFHHVYHHVTGEK